MSCIERVVLVALLAATPAWAGVQPQLLPLTGPLDDPLAEVSGMDWHGDTLIILPQFPELFAGDGLLGFFAIEKQEILAVLDGGKREPIKPRRVLGQPSDLAGIVCGYDGLEAIGCAGDRFYVTVEAESDTGMAAFLVGGHWDVIDGRFVLDLPGMSSIPMKLNIPNLAEESVVIDGERVITIYEANGGNVNPAPVAKVFNADAEFTGFLPMPRIEYRVTDATALDEDGRFWVINYFFPPEKTLLDPAPDAELVRFGDPATFDADRCIERLLELRLTADGGIVRTDTPPLNLELRSDGECRNWEALVRLDDRGFLMMTDHYPGTLLAFVPFPK